MSQCTQDFPLQVFEECLNVHSIFFLFTLKMLFLKFEFIIEQITNKHLIMVAVEHLLKRRNILQEQNFSLKLFQYFLESLTLSSTKFN